jgi:AraC-like DNA-binding protein
MGLSFELLLVGSCIGVFQSAFLGIYLFTWQRRRTISNLLLALLMIAFAIRIFKSISYYFAEGHEIPTLLMNFGFGTNLAIMPLLWLYLNSFVNPGFVLSWRRDFLQLIPCVTALILSPFLTDHFWLNQYGYTISLLSMLIYLPFCVHLIITHRAGLSRVQKVWIISLVGGVTVVWFAYLGNFVFGVVPYIASPVLFSLVICSLSFLGLGEKSIFMRDSKYQSSGYSEQLIAACSSRLRQHFLEHQVYRDPAITLPGLARQLGVTPNLLSETVNKKEGLSFPDFINRCRVQDAKAMLENQAYGHLKIATIAFETGFSSVSAFNTAFKKFTETTPSTFRKRAQKA